MVKQSFGQCASFLLAALLTATAWAADSPIGNLKVQGTATIESPASAFTLTDQQYAYFSGDGVRAEQGAQAVLGLNEGLDVTFIGPAKGSVSRQDGVYNIEIQQGHVLVEAGSGVDYRMSHDGEAISPDQPLSASDTPFVVSVAEAGDVQFYMPAQLDEGEDDDDRAAAGLGGSLKRAGVSPGQIAVIVAAIFGAVAILDDDGGPPIADEPIPDKPIPPDVPIPDVPIPDDDGPSS